MEKWAVEARIFNNGKIMAKLRKAEDGEEGGCHETRTCDIWVDVFESEKEALQFLADYRKA